MKADVTVHDDHLRWRARGLHQRHINLRVHASGGFACEPVRMLMYTRAKIPPKQRLAV